MKKIYLVVAGAFLILLVITSMLLSLGKKPTTNTQNNSPFPTGVPRQGNVVLPQATLPPDIQNNTANSSINISTIAPVETPDFKVQYSSRLNKLVVEKKTPQAEEQFLNWANQNQLPQLVKNSNLVLIVDQGKNPDDFNPLIDFLNIFMTFGQGSSSSNEQINSSPASSPSPVTNNPTQNNNQSRVYYAQCGDQGSIPLPGGGNLCSAGCGPTSVAMIASSYVNKQYDPKTIVDLYKSNNYLLGSSGSRYSDAHELLKSFGLKTTDYLVFDSEKADTVVPQLRKYLSAGWTFFTLASFCEKGCGHYFWIIDIDSKGNIIAYDPAYGRYKIPYNENSRYPYPLYRLAFGVKK